MAATQARRVSTARTRARCGAALLAVLVATLVAMTSAAPAAWASGTFPGGNGKLAFSHRDQVHTISPRGTDRRRLTSVGKNYAPAWSPDGERIAYVHEDGNGSHDIWVMRADGSGKRQVTRSHFVTGGPSWSPDGKRLLFADDQLVFTQALSSPYAEPVTACGLDAIESGEDVPLGTSCTEDQSVDQLRALGTPEWSPDGRHIALTTTGGVYDTVVLLWSGNDNRIATVAADGGGGTYGYYGTAYSWAPDGRSFAVAHRDEARGGGQDPSRVGVFGLPGTDPLGVASIAYDHDPAFSPSGRKIALVNDAGGTPAIFTSYLDGSQRRKLTAGHDPAWQPRR